MFQLCLRGENKSCFAVKKVVSTVQKDVFPQWFYSEKKCVSTVFERLQKSCFDGKRKGLFAMRIEFLCLSSRGIQQISTVQHWMHMLKLVMQHFCYAIAEDTGGAWTRGLVASMYWAPHSWWLLARPQSSHIHSFLLFLAGWHFVNLALFLGG